MKKPKRPKPKQKQKRSIPPPKQKPKSVPTPTHRRWFAAAKLATLFGVGAIGLVASIDAIWGPIWPTAPLIDVGAPSSDGPLSVPFQVTNASILFPLHHLKLKCGIDYLQTARGRGIEKLFIEASGDNDLGTSHTAPYKCAPIFNFGKTHFVAGRIYIWGSYETPIFGKRSFQSVPFTWDSTSSPPRWLKGTPLK